MVTKYTATIEYTASKTEEKTRRHHRKTSYLLCLSFGLWNKAITKVKKVVTNGIYSFRQEIL
jgi:hypothetical protein